MKNLFYHFLLISSVALVALPKSTNACGPEMDERSFSLFFNPYNGNAVSSSKSEYLYNPYRFTYDFSGQSEVVTEKEQNLSEWAEALNRTSDNSLEMFVYGDHTITLEKLIAAKKEGLKYEDVAPGMHKSIFKELYKRLEFLQYFYVIHDYSYNVNNLSDEWDYAYHVNKADARKMAANLALAKEVYTSLSKQNDKLSNMFKVRLAYHLIRAPHFNKDYATADKNFETFAKPVIGPISTSIVQEWIAGIRGGMLSRLNRKEEAFLWFAKKFNQGGASAHPAYIDLKWVSNEIKTPNALKWAKNKQDSLDVYNALTATNSKLNSKYVNGIISKVDEKTAFFMWYRELQKVEETYYHPKICDYAKDRWDDYGYYLDDNKSVIINNHKQFIKLTNHLYRNAKTTKYKDHYANALAYTSILDNNAEEAYTYLEREFTVPEAKLQNLVLSILQQTKDSYSIQQIDIEKILQLWKTNYQHSYENTDVVEYLIADFIAPHYYYKQNDKLGAIALWGMANYQSGEKKSIQLARSEVVNHLLNYTFDTEEYLALNDRVTSYDHHILQWAQRSGINIELESYTPLKFYKHVRDENWIEAKEELDFSNAEFYSPFVMHYDGYYSPTSADYERPMLSSDEFFALGNKLKTKAEEDPTGQNHLNYGMYLLSTSFIGHNSLSDDNSLRYQQGYTSPEFYYNDKFVATANYGDIYNAYSFTANKEALDFYYCFKAEEHLKLAMELLDKEESKAMCCFLLARCYQTRNPIPELVENKYGYKDAKMVTYKGEEYSSFELYELRNPYLGQMKREFSNTKTYKEAYSQCNNLRHYLE